ncbi:MAG: hydroxylamine reductase [Sarcina sp.]
MKSPMFCYQCEQTAGGVACTKFGVCGKSPTIAGLQDLIIYELKGMACYANVILEKGHSIEKRYIEFIENSLFMTLTNVNFNEKDHFQCVKDSSFFKMQLKQKAQIDLNVNEAKFVLPEENIDILAQVHISRLDIEDGENKDVRSLKHTILYGLKGIAAYGHQARILNRNSEMVDNFYIEALEFLTKEITLEDGIDMVIKTGAIALEVMRLLDQSNTTVYDDPVPTKVNINHKKGPFIVVSGHDLKDLEMLLEQAKEKGVNIYTHGEMLPAHGYPQLKKWENLIGNFGGAWQDQQREFDNLKGCILMTTNCIMKPRESYKDRIFTTSVVGYDEVKHIPRDEYDEKDFTLIINKAIELGGFEEDEEEKEILVGFGHKATLSNAGLIVDCVKEGAIKHFFVIGGCDGAKTGRNYYTEFATSVPSDCIILTLACGKYRFNKLEFGQIKGIPRLLDIGQCNDLYSATKIATALAQAFNTEINKLPLSIILSWYEQKAVADLLALLALDIKNMYIGPSIPAFFTKNIIEYLSETYNLTPISDVKNDLNKILK